MPSTTYTIHGEYTTLTTPSAMLAEILSSDGHRVTAVTEADR